MSRRWLDEEAAAGLGRLDPEAIARVREEAWPSADSADELHDALLGLAFRHRRRRSPRSEPWRALLAALADAGRVTRSACSAPASAETTTAGERALWIAAERLPQFAGRVPAARHSPPIAAPAEFAARTWSRRRSAGRDRARPARRAGAGHRRCARRVDGAAACATSKRRSRSSRRKASPCAARSRPARARPNGASGRCSRASIAIRSSGCAQEIEPVSSQDFMRFLCRWQHVDSERAAAKVPTRWRR